MIISEGRASARPIYSISKAQRRGRAEARPSAAVFAGSSARRVTGRILRGDRHGHVFHGFLYLFDIRMDFLKQIMLGLRQLLDPLGDVVQFPQHHFLTR